MVVSITTGSNHADREGPFPVEMLRVKSRDSIRMYTVNVDKMFNLRAYPGENIHRNNWALLLRISRYFRMVRNMCSTGTGSFGKVKFTFAYSIVRIQIEVKVFISNFIAKKSRFLAVFLRLYGSVQAGKE